LRWRGGLGLGLGLGWFGLFRNEGVLFLISAFWFWEGEVNTRKAVLNHVLQFNIELRLLGCHEL
jgi:hypothetical protein